MTLVGTIRETQRPVRSSGYADAQLRGVVGHLAECECPVLIVGEHGAGKRFAATQIHLQSHRSRSTYQELNCIELDAQTILSALSTKKTVYLIEVADLDPSLQELLIRAYFLSDQPQNCHLVFGSSRELPEEVKSRRITFDSPYAEQGIVMVAANSQEEWCEVRLKGLTIGWGPNINEHRRSGDTRFRKAGVDDIASSYFL